MRLSRGSTISLCVLLAVDKAIAVEPVNDFTRKEFVVPYPVLQCARGLTFKIELMSAFGTKRTSSVYITAGNLESHSTS